jgi:uncharacterized membrane protein (UPF0127 family)
MICGVLRTPAAALSLALLVAACSGPGNTPPVAYAHRARFETAAGEALLRVALARTPEERERGLMGLRSLPGDAGMAFLWTAPTTSAFWMKDTRIPLDIAFVDGRGEIVSIREMPPCAADPCPLYRSSAPYLVAIEANAGWFESHGVREGDTVTVETST